MSDSDDSDDDDYAESSTHYTVAISSAQGRAQA